MQRRIPFHSSTILVTALLSSSAGARSAGISGRTDVAGSGCGSCHGSQSSATVVSLTGPSELAAGSTGSYSVTIEGEPAVVGGLDVKTSAGVLLPGEGSKLLDGELVHDGSRAAVNGVIRFDFQLTAPQGEGSLVLHATGNSANGDGTRSELDNWNFAAPLTVTVTAPSDPGTSPEPAPEPDPVAPGEELPGTTGGTPAAPGGSAEPSAPSESAAGPSNPAETSAGCSASGGPLSLLGWLLLGWRRRRS